MTDEELNKEGEEAIENWVEFMKQELDQRNSLLNHIENLKTKSYREAVVDCLDEAKSTGNLTLIDVCSINGDYQEENWKEFNHIYVNQTIDGRMAGDEFAGYIYIPITKKLYLKSYYSM